MKKLVEPIGKTCSQISINCNNTKIVLDQYDKEMIDLSFNEVIEEDDALEIFVTSIDIERATCKVRIVGLKKRVTAMIIGENTFRSNSDPYSNAVASRNKITVKATKIFRGSELRRILIKGLSD